jgi:hypothetical protein
MEKQIYRPVERRVFMGEKHRFFDSIEGEDERQYTADEFAEYFRQFIRNGIFSGGENLKVETNEQDMKVFINPGYAWIEGYLYKIDTEPLVMEHKIADPSLNRIDRVVVRLDKTLENRYVKVFILEGTPAETPQVPELTRDNNIYEISLAQIEIIAGKSFIEAYQITDERLNNDVCGIATHLFEQVETTDIFNEWISYLNNKKEEANLSYDAFVNAYQTTWNNWIEEKISEPGGEFYAEWKDWFSELQDITNLVTLTQFNEHLDHTNKEAHKAQNISLNSGNFNSSNVKEGMEELFTNVNNGKQKVATSITDMGVNAYGSDTFTQLATKISEIPIGAKLNSVQSGVTNTIISSVSVNISSIDLSKSILFFTVLSNVSGSASDWQSSMVVGRFYNSSTIRFERSDYSDSVDIYWFVVEFSEGVSVQSIYGSFGNNGSIRSTNEYISAVDLNRSFLVESHTAEYEESRLNTIGVEFDSETTVKLTRHTSGSYMAGLTYSIFVIEF